MGIKNKRGSVDTLFEQLGSIILALMVFGALFWFVAKQGKGELIQEQVIAKEACLIASSAISGSSIEIEHAKNIVIEKKGSGILVKGSKASPGYFYPCDLENAELLNKENKTYIGIK